MCVGLRKMLLLMMNSLSRRRQRMTLEHCVHNLRGTIKLFTGFGRNGSLGAIIESIECIIQFSLRDRLATIDISIIKKLKESLFLDI